MSANDMSPFFLRAARAASSTAEALPLSRSFTPDAAEPPWRMYESMSCCCS